ncbi:hypothetical protein ACJX0J_015547, partial [Zea mays]
VNSILVLVNSVSVYFAEIDWHVPLHLSEVHHMDIVVQMQQCYVLGMPHKMSDCFFSFSISPTNDLGFDEIQVKWILWDVDIIGDDSNNNNCYTCNLYIKVTKYAT